MPPEEKKHRGGPPASTEFGRQCDARRIPAPVLAAIGLSSISAANSWRQGARKPSKAKAIVICRGLRKKYRWRISPARLLSMMVPDAPKQPE